jgi:hypothetical protein
MKRQQETVGSIVQIHVNDEFYVYAQILPHGLLAFFDYKKWECYGSLGKK